MPKKLDKCVAVLVFPKSVSTAVGNTYWNVFRVLTPVGLPAYPSHMRKILLIRDSNPDISGHGSACLNAPNADTLPKQLNKEIFPESVYSKVVLTGRSEPAVRINTGLPEIRLCLIAHKLIKLLSA